MQLLAGIGTLAFLAVGAIVGARLLLLARRTHQRPELYVGGALFLYAVLGQPAIVTSRPAGDAFGQWASLTLLFIGLTANVATVAGMYAFTTMVFRPDSRLARMMIWCGTLLTAGCAVTLLFESSNRELGASYSLTTKIAIAILALNFSAVMFWTAVESLRYRRLLGKRLRLGLADPVVVNRFGLWGGGCLVCAASAIVLIGCVAAGMNVTTDPVPILSTALSGSFIGACWYLSFLAPPFYLRWVRAGADQPDSAA